ncbi:MAG: carboxymuconolactone decarboxylase family protein [Actinomycetota bacterium]
MTRLTPKDWNNVSPAQREIYEALMERRDLRTDGDIGGPFDAWILNPELHRRAAGLGLMFERRTSFPYRLVKVVILTVAAHYRANYPWAVHSRYALDHGVPQAVIDSIHNGTPPPFDDDHDRIVHTLATELLETHELSDQTYAEAIAAFDEIGVAELANLTGFYVMVAMTLNTFHVPEPEWAESTPFPRP